MIFLSASSSFVIINPLTLYFNKGQRQKRVRN
jgi:hypothetical protein